MDTNNIDKLINDFVLNTRTHYAETLEGHYKIVNKCAREVDKIYKKLKALDTEGLSALRV
jgi:hypothetical protein